MRLKIFRFTFLWFLFFLLTLTGSWLPAQAYEVNKNAVTLLVARNSAGKMISTGTGFVIRPEGVLLTNYHVLVDAVTLDAVFPNGDMVPVESIFNLDRIKDVAVLKLKDGFYSTLELGDSDQVREFDYSSALGYLSNEVREGNHRFHGDLIQTYGFVLGVHPQAYPDFPYIYTTTPFGPGFSGGPMVDKNNKVIGIATIEGREINLALPINLVKPLLEQNLRLSFGKLLEEDRNSKEAIYYRGNFALYALGDTESAIRYFQNTLRKDPTFVPALYDLAVANRNKGLIEESTANYEKILQINPQFPEVLSNLGGYYFRAGKIEKAVELFERAVKIYPNFIQAHSNLGAVLNKLNRPKEALPHLRKAVLIDPEFAIAYFNLGNSYFALNQLDEAEKAYRKSQDLGVDFLSMHWKLYEVYNRQGRKREAEKQLKIILRIDPSDPDAKQKLLELQAPANK